MPHAATTPPKFGPLSLPGWAQGLFVRLGLAEDAPALRPTPEQRDALERINEIGPVRQAVTYTRAHLGGDRAEPVATISGLYGVVVIPDTLYAELTQAGWIAPGARLTPSGRAALAQPD